MTDNDEKITAVAYHLKDDEFETLSKGGSIEIVLPATENRQVGDVVGVGKESVLVQLDGRVSDKAMFAASDELFKPEAETTVSKVEIFDIKNEAHVKRMVVSTGLPADQIQRKLGVKDVPPLCFVTLEPSRGFAPTVRTFGVVSDKPLRYN